MFMRYVTHIYNVKYKDSEATDGATDDELELTDLSEAESMGDTMDVPKKDGDIRFLSFNPRGIKIGDLQV